MGLIIDYLKVAANATVGSPEFASWMALGLAELQQATHLTSEVLQQQYVPGLPGTILPSEAAAAREQSIEM